MLLLFQILEEDNTENSLPALQQAADVSLREAVEKQEEQLMIGFYNYTVILTYISLVSSMIGIACAKLNHPLMAIFALLFCGLCDMFDGKVARSKTDRTDEEKKFGIQIDSLCDLVCFGVLPASICLEIWGESIHNRFVWVLITAICAFYVLAGLIRLAYFNVTEETRQSQTDEVRAKYQGLPITTAALIIPVVYILRYFVPCNAFPWVYTGALLLVAILFITPFSIKKPKLAASLVMLAAGLFIALILLLVAKHSHSKRQAEQPRQAVKSSVEILQASPCTAGLDILF